MLVARTLPLIPENLLRSFSGTTGMALGLPIGAKSRE